MYTQYLFLKKDNQTQTQITQKHILTQTYSHLFTQHAQTHARMQEQPQTHLQTHKQKHK